MCSLLSLPTSLAPSRLRLGPAKRATTPACSTRMRTQRATHAQHSAYVLPRQAAPVLGFVSLHRPERSCVDDFLHTRLISAYRTFCFFCTKSKLVKIVFSARTCFWRL